MTRSYGSGPGGPDWQRKNKQQPGFRQREPQPELRQRPDDQTEYDDYEDDYQKQDETEPGWENRLNKLSRYSKHEESVQAERVDFGKRLVALMIDLFASYIVSAVVAILPIINGFVHQNLVMMLFLLVRDFLFQGRGIGKNLMGLQVVDTRTGHPCNLGQSIRRNIFVLGPLLILQVVYVCVHIFNAVTHGIFGSNPQVIQVINWLNEALPGLISGIGGAYICFAIPYEAYRVYTRADGRRFGDQFAGTAVVEAPMDWSTPVAR